MLLRDAQSYGFVDKNFLHFPNYAQFSSSYFCQDVLGRLVIEAHINNVDSNSMRDLVVRYKYSPFALLQRPVFVGLIVIAAMIVSRFASLVGLNGKILDEGIKNSSKKVN